jgi:hypothetical protein
MSGKERKRDKVKKKIKKLYERLKKSTDLPKEVMLQVQTALQDVSGPSLYIGGGPPSCKTESRKYRFSKNNRYCSGGRRSKSFFSRILCPSMGP